ncbi:MAG: TAXI family TRAP transporter solute-binding subunit [Rhodospirillales bacterium]
MLAEMKLGGTIMRLPVLVFAAIAAVIFSTASVCAQDGTRLTITGGSPAGLWSMLGAGIDSSYREDNSNNVVTYQTSGGGLANVAIVSAGQAELGIIHNIELKAAAEGQAPFKAPVNNLRAIGVLYNWAPMQMVITAKFADEYGIKTMRDVAEKKPPLRIAVNQRGNMVQETNRQILAAYGVSYEDIESWGGQIVFAPGGDMVNLFNDGRIDMGGNGVFVPDKRFVQVSQTMDLRILPLDQDVIEKVSAQTGAEPYVISAGGYPWQEEDVPTVALSAVLVANSAMSDDIAYNLAKAITVHVDKIRAVHKAMKKLSPDLFASLKVIPYHPGAERYYREVGLAK